MINKSMNSEERKKLSIDVQRAILNSFNEIRARKNLRPLNQPIRFDLTIFDTNAKDQICVTEVKSIVPDGLIEFELNKEYPHNPPLQHLFDMLDKE